MTYNPIYRERLSGEWKTHGKIVIGVDFDSTISPYHTLDNQEDIDRAIKILKDCQLVGCYTVIHTACNPDRHGDILSYCEKIGLKVDTINETPSELPIQYGRAGSKPYCNIFIDDRAGLGQALDILEDCMILQRSHKYAERSDYPGWAG